MLLLVATVQNTLGRVTALNFFGIFDAEIGDSAAEVLLVGLIKFTFPLDRKRLPVQTRSRPDNSGWDVIKADVFN